MSLMRFGRASGPSSGRRRSLGGAALMVCVLALGGLAWPQGARAQSHQHGVAPATEQVAQAAQTAPADASGPAAPVAEGKPSVSYHAPLTFTLLTGIAEGRMV